MNKHEVELLSQEIEMLMNQRASLLKVVGAAAVLVVTPMLRACRRVRWTRRKCCQRR